jgi:hypothetical protein
MVEMTILLAPQGMTEGEVIEAGRVAPRCDANLRSGGA